MADSNHLRIGFFGTSDFALETLTALYEHPIDIKFVVSQNPKPSGRGQKVNFSPVYKFAKFHNLNTFTPENINNLEFINKIKNFEIDFLIIVAYGKIINERILKLPKFFSLNIHASILPKWRGAAPIQRSILNGDNETGISIIVVEPKLDSGPIVLSKKIKINRNDNTGFLYKKLSTLGSKLILEAISNISKNNYTLIKQDEAKSSYAKKISKTETKISWTDSAQSIHRMVRAFTPWPGAWTFWKKEEKKIRFKILESEIIEKFNENSMCLNIGQSDRNLIVKCKKNYLKLKKIQLEGKKVISGDEFINGFKLKNYDFD